MRQVVQGLKSNEIKAEQVIHNEGFMKSAASDRHPLINFGGLVYTTPSTFEIQVSLSIGEPVAL